MRHTRAGTYILTSLLLLMVAGCEFTKQSVVSPPNGNPTDTTGNGDSTDVTVQVSVSPAAALVLIGQTEQFFATVTGTASQSVVWTVDSGPGSISADGIYTAPASITGDTVAVVVKAVSSADSRASATANIKVTKPPQTGGGDTLEPGEICFEREVLPIFLSNCTMSGCHDAISRADGKNFTTYAGIMTEIRPGRPQNSDIYHAITEDDSDDRMPPPPRSPLSSDQIQTIRTWIEQGAKNTKCSTGNPGGCDTSNVTFTAMIRPIMQTNCTGCHSGPAPSAGYNLASYTGVKAAVDNGRLLGAVSHAPGFVPMPQGGAKLPDCDIAKIRTWIRNGAPNN